MIRVVIRSRVYLFQADKNESVKSTSTSWTAYLTNSAVTLNLLGTITILVRCDVIAQAIRDLGEWAIAAHGMYESHQV
jgi:hypothetical protein